MRDDQLFAVKERAADRFMGLPGVTAVGIGARERAGRRTGELVIKVFVEVKRPLEELSPEQRLPAEFEGVPIDVGVCGYGTLTAGTVIQSTGPPAPPIQPGPVPGSRPTVQGTTDDGRYRPLTGGGRIQPDLDGAGVGTLGCFLKHKTDAGKIYGLTNYHVLTVEKPLKTPVLNTTKVGQPTAADSPTKCSSSMIGVYAGGTPDNTRDAALVQLDPGQEWLAEILDIGPVKGPHPLTTADASQVPAYQLRKHGQRTGLTGGTIAALAATAVVDGVARSNTTLVTPNPNPDLGAGEELFFGDRGDSGSAVVNDSAEVVGLLYGRSSPPPPGQPDNRIRLGFVTPINVVLSQFDAIDHVPVELATATANGLKNKVPGATLRATPLREPAPAPPGVPPAHPDLMAKVSQDLDRSEAGRLLITLWLDHHAELLDLVDRRRRVTIAWHRGGGPAILQTLIRMAADPALAMPVTVNGVPPMDRLTHIHAVFHAHASPGLRRALDRALAAVPDPAALTYDQILAALATR